MASYNELNALIDAYINRNGVQAITGQILNGVLKAMVEQLGRGYTIMGAAIPTTDPGTPDGPECYFASETGTYTDFDGLQVAPGELALLCYTPSDGWTKATIYEGFRQVGATIDGNVGTPSVGVSYANGVLSFDFHNMKGNPGQNGQDGQDGAAAGFGTIGADITGGVGTPGVTVESSGPATAKNLQFHFTNLKGETGVTSVVATVDNTTGTPACTVSLVGQQLTLAFTGLKGAQGDTGSSVDYPFTIVNNLTTDDATQALSAAQGVVLDGKVTQLEAKVDDLDADLNGKQKTIYTFESGSIAAGEDRDSNNYIRTPNDAKIPITENTDLVFNTTKNATFGQCAIYKYLNGTYVGSAALPNFVNGEPVSIVFDGTFDEFRVRVSASSNWTQEQISNTNLSKGEDKEGLVDRIVSIEGAVAEIEEEQAEIGEELQEQSGRISDIEDEFDYVQNIYPFELGGIAAGQDQDATNYMRTPAASPIPVTANVVLTFAIKGNASAYSYAMYKYLDGAYIGATQTASMEDGMQLPITYDGSFNQVRFRVSKTTHWTDAQIAESFATDGPIPIKKSFNTRLTEAEERITGLEGDVVELNERIDEIPSQVASKYKNITYVYSAKKRLLSKEEQTALGIEPSVHNNNITSFLQIVHMTDIHADWPRAKGGFDVATLLGLTLINTGDNAVSFTADKAQYDAMVNAFTGNFLHCIGNHDAWQTTDNAALVAKYITPFATRFGWVVATDTDAAYYYKDDSTYNIRYIVLNQYVRYGQNIGSVYYGQSQINWLVSTLLSTPSGYGVIVVMHGPEVVPTISQSYGKFFQKHTYETVRLFSSHRVVAKVIDAFISKTTINETVTTDTETLTITADFSQLTSSEFVAYICGHTHMDFISFVPDCNNRQLLLCCTTASTIYNTTGDQIAETSDLARVVDTETQFAFNVYTIDRDRKVVKVVRIGADVPFDMPERRDYMEIPYADSPFGN